MAVLLVAASTAAADFARLSGFVDGYYAANDNRAPSGHNFFPGTGTTAARANELALNIAALEIVRDPRPLGFHISIVSGDAADVVHAGEPRPRRHPYRNIYQASASLQATPRLLLEGGIYPSHIGFEAFFSKDNWNYTRGWLGELSPYYQTGLKASYAWSERWSGQLHVVKGWQLVADNNSAKSVGTQIAYASSRFSAALNTMAGAELPDDAVHLRRFVDLIATWKTTPKLSIGASLDRGRQALPGGAAANWLGVGGYARYELSDGRAVALRAEHFRDPDGGISGTAQRLDEGTLTYELRPQKHLILKFEGRHDRSSASVFDGASTQTLLIGSAVAHF